MRITALSALALFAISLAGAHGTPGSQGGEHDATCAGAGAERIAKDVAGK